MPRSLDGDKGGASGGCSSSCASSGFIIGPRGSHQLGLVEKISTHQPSNQPSSSSQPPPTRPDLPRKLLEIFLLHTVTMFCELFISPMLVCRLALLGGMAPRMCSSRNPPAKPGQQGLFDCFWRATNHYNNLLRTSAKSWKRYILRGFSCAFLREWFTYRWFLEVSQTIMTIQIFHLPWGFHWARQLLLYCRKCQTYHAAS